jgi:hypothetical protein
VLGVTMLEWEVEKSNAEKCLQQKNKVVENLRKVEQLVESVELEILTDT